MLTIRPWRFGWVVLIHPCGIAACCVWMAYAPAVSIVSAKNGSNSHTWMAQGVRRLLFNPVGAGSIPPPSPVPVMVDTSWFSVENPYVALACRWRSITVASAHNGRFIKVDNPGGKYVWWTNRGWRKQPYTDFLS